MVFGIRGAQGVDTFLGYYQNWLRANRPAEFNDNVQKAAKWIGQQRGGYGNPFDVNTQSGSSLAKDFLKVTAATLQRARSARSCSPTAA